MANNKGYSKRNAFTDGYTHYDSKGHKTGESRRNWGGGYTEYDAKGKKVGESRPNWGGGYTHYDSKGHKTGESRYSISGYSHYDNKGHKIGESNLNWADGYNHIDRTTEGCYIATCIYGSYDCPQVWTLRRFRDSILGRSWAGRGFIRFYYATSPFLVQRFGEQAWFRHLFSLPLDLFIRILQEIGIDDTPYEDRNWRKCGI